MEKKFTADVLAGITVRQHPFAVRRIGTVTVPGKYILADDPAFMAPVGVKIILPFVTVTVGKVDNVISIRPGVMTAHQFQI